MESLKNSPPLKTAKDFASEQEVKWCPGCGDYAILAQIQKVLAELNRKNEDVVFVSGIGCSSRFTYYMNTYGIHGIHGRPIAIASGLKIARPELDVWVITGDGDCLSIGGNHFIHGLRRNIGLHVIMFNNRIYALTKGQYSPTSEQNKITYSTPYGSIDYPINPLALALGSGACFVARTIDKDLKHMNYIFKEAAQFKGTSFVEVYQNCKIFNDEAFSLFTEKETKEQNTLYLEDGKPLVFGKEKEFGIILENFQPKIINLKNESVNLDKLWIHDVKNKQKAFLLTQFSMPGYEEFPSVFGIIYKEDKPSYEQLLIDKIEQLKTKRPAPPLDKLLAGSNTWEV
ncbi:MAG: 2-oxoglutarate ferredoxin oxidoreductase subunit beta [Bacteroidia bacterium]|nr:MAG: 2-oxoglutarate ferredoxin oxidoreductase subunit beta [Bacteroidia bacterium]